MVKKFQFQKIIRTGRLADMQATGVTIQSRLLNVDEALEALKAKCVEESYEIAHTESTHDLTNELADLLECIHSIAHLKNISIETIEAKRIEKRDNYGPLDLKTFIESIVLDEDHPHYQYYAQQAQKYPPC